MRKMHVIPMAMQPPPKEGQKMKSIIVCMVMAVSMFLGSAKAADMPATTENNQQEETWGTRQQVLQEQYQQQRGQQSAWEERQQALQKQNQQQRKQQFQQQTEQQVDPTSGCSNQIVSKKELQILKGKIDLEGSDDPPFEMLANNKVPTKKEKGAILLWVSEEKRCKQLGDEWRNNNYPPAINAIFEKVFSDMLFLAADLYAAKINYGDFAKAQVKLYQEFNTNVAGVIQQERQQQQAELQRSEDLANQQQMQQQMQQQQAENIRRDELAARQQQQQNKPAPYQLPAPYQMPIPKTTTTTCGWQGSQWVCNTGQTGLDFDRR